MHSQTAGIPVLERKVYNSLTLKRSFSSGCKLVHLLQTRLMKPNIFSIAIHKFYY